jgi:hypothetical protein
VCDGTGDRVVNSSEEEYRAARVRQFHL